MSPERSTARPTEGSVRVRRRLVRRELGREVIRLAKNTGKGRRVGAVRNRSEFKHPNGTHVKRDTRTGRILNVSEKPHKGVRDER